MCQKRVTEVITVGDNFRIPQQKLASSEAMLVNFIHICNIRMKWVFQVCMKYLSRKYFTRFSISDRVSLYLATESCSSCNFPQMHTSTIVNNDQQDATILVYLFIPNQLYMFRAMSSPIIRSI